MCSWALVLTLVIGARWTPVATAADGRYTIHECKLPDGRSAGVDGFQSTNVQRSLLLENACGAGGSLRAAVLSSEAQPNRAYAAWSWAVAPGTTLLSVRVWRSVTVVSGDYAYGAEAITSPDLRFDPANDKEVCSVYQGCLTLGDHNAWNDPANLATFDLGRTSAIHFAAFCNTVDGGSCPARSDGVPTADVRVHRFEAVVSDDSRPVVDAVAGSFPVASKLKAPTDVRLQASDHGAGIYRLFTQYLDDRGAWQTVQVQSAADQALCRDQVAGNADPYEFSARQPCPPAIDRSFVVDTGAVPNGQRTLRLVLEDAGGNPTEVTRLQALVANGRGMANGTGGSDVAVLHAAWYRGARRLHRAARMLSYRAGALLRGRLLNAAGQPIAGAQIQLFAQPVRTNSVRQQVASILTDARGTFAKRVAPRQQSQRLELEYRAYSEDETPAARAALHTIVRPQVSLDVRIRASVVIYLGHLRSRPMPAGGKLVVLQGRRAGARAWETFASKRASDRTGLFRGTYVLHGRAPGVRLQFRVLVPREGAYGFAQGHSATITRVEP